MADNVQVGGFKLAGNIVRTPDGCYESTISLTYAVNPSELPASLKAGRQVIQDLIDHAQGCESLGEAIVKLFGMNGKVFKHDAPAAAANDNPAPAADTPPAGGENGEQAQS